MCIVKVTINKMKRQSTEYKKIFSNHIFNMGLISNIYTTQTTQYKRLIPDKNLVKDLSRHFSKEDIQMADRCVLRCSISPSIKEIQIKIMMRYQTCLLGWLLFF